MKMKIKSLTISTLFLLSLFSISKADTIYGIYGNAVPELRQSWAPDPFLGSMTVNDSATAGSLSVYVPATGVSKSFDFTMITNIPSIPPIGQSVRIFGDPTGADNAVTFYDWEGLSGTTFDGTELINSLGNDGWDAILISSTVLGDPVNFSITDITKDVPHVTEPASMSLFCMASLVMFGLFRSIMPKIN